MEQLPPPLRVALRGSRLKHYPRGQIILYEGDMPLEVSVLLAGVIKLYDIDEQGNEKILHLVKPPAIIPFAFFSGGRDPTRWFYTAVMDCDVRVLSLALLLRRLQADSELAVYCMNWFSLEMHELLVRLSSLSKTNARSKLIAALTFLATHHAVQRRSGWWRVAFPVNQQLLADMTGVTRESAAVVLKGLQDEQLIRHPRLTILEINLERLTEPLAAAVR